jgi:hypothetical protein
MKILILLCSLLFITSCVEERVTTIDYPSVAYKKLDENKKLWEKTNLKHYSFVVQRSCFCPREEKRQISVNDAQITEAKYIPSNTPLSNKIKVKNIEDYFIIIQDALDKNAFKVTVTYNKTYGFPSKMAIDFDAQVADEELYYSLTHFNPTLDDGDIVCTEEYAPICGEVSIQCITTPCESIKNTFSNRCHLNANPNATYLRNGECK